MFVVAQVCDVSVLCILPSLLLQICRRPARIHRCGQAGAVRILASVEGAREQGLLRYDGI